VLIDADAIVCGVRHHGESGTIARALTREHGMLPGYVRGGRGRGLRPVLIPGNRIIGQWRARNADQLPALTVDLLESRAALLGEPLAAAAIDWTTALTVAALPEGQRYRDVHDALAGLLDAIALAPAARSWSGALVRYELLVLARLGFGLALEHCVVTGAATDLAFVSPKSAAAVSVAAAMGYEERLLPLPAFLRDGGVPDIVEVLKGLELSGHFLEMRLFEKRRSVLFAARARLVDRLQRMQG
jgi:DNA repair protein RecO (recombination protein O)